MCEVFVCAQAFAEQHGLPFCEVSAKTGAGIDEMFNEAARAVLQNRTANNSSPPQPVSSASAPTSSPQKFESAPATAVTDAATAIAAATAAATAKQTSS